MFLRLFRITQGVAESTHIISYYFFALFSSLFSIFFLKFPLFFYFLKRLLSDKYCIKRLYVDTIYADFYNFKYTLFYLFLL